MDLLHSLRNVHVMQVITWELNVPTLFHLRYSAFQSVQLRICFAQIACKVTIRFSRRTTLRRLSRDTFFCNVNA